MLSKPDSFLLKVSSLLKSFASQIPYVFLKIKKILAYKWLQKLLKLKKVSVQIFIAMFNDIYDFKR